MVMADGDSGDPDEMVQMQVRLRRREKCAIEQWAADEDRTAAAQARVVLRGAIPAKYLSDEP